ncbi:hypothetical protein NDU88_010679 [Pleurodeles waltl]|uniref:Uncharacterized protein n=1 Tax=Pleurodeles waltl TaxID=8319 RepID=A0AAV7Q2Y6_PLEWA|nr:hypothetical protein NDU88_010679 [Pleurodeles waltl]
MEPHNTGTLCGRSTYFQYYVWKGPHTTSTVFGRSTYFQYYVWNHITPVLCVEGRSRTPLHRFNAKGPRPRCATRGSILAPTEFNLFNSDLLGVPVSTECAPDQSPPGLQRSVHSPDPYCGPNGASVSQQAAGVMVFGGAACEIDGALD